MRRILIEAARRKGRDRHGAGRSKMDLESLMQAGPDEELLALQRLTSSPRSPQGKLVELRFFGGLTLAQAAECLNISLSTADRGWRYARAWLYTAMSDESPEKK